MRTTFTAPVWASETIAAIERLREERGFPPTFREVATALGQKSVAPVYYRLFILKENGMVTWEEELGRTLRVVKKEP